jgi:hypothetical protein
MGIKKTRLHTDGLLLRMVIEDLESLLGVKGAYPITSLVLQAREKIEELERSGAVRDSVEVSQTRPERSGAPLS